MALHRGSCTANDGLEPLGAGPVLPTSYRHWAGRRIGTWRTRSPGCCVSPARRSTPARVKPSVWPSLTCRGSRGRETLASAAREPIRGRDLVSAAMEPLRHALHCRKPRPRSRGCRGSVVTDGSQWPAMSRRLGGLRIGSKPPDGRVVTDSEQPASLACSRDRRSPTHQLPGSQPARLCLGKARVRPTRGALPLFDRSESPRGAAGTAAPVGKAVAAGVPADGRPLGVSSGGSYATPSSPLGERLGAGCGVAVCVRFRNDAGHRTGSRRSPRPASVAARSPTDSPSGGRRRAPDAPSPSCRGSFAALAERVGPVPLRHCGGGHGFSSDVAAWLRHNPSAVTWTGAPVVLGSARSSVNRAP